MCALVPEPGLSFSDQLSGSTEQILLFEGGRMVDDEGRFIGAITVDDVLDVLLKESWRRGRSRGFGG